MKVLIYQDGHAAIIKWGLPPELAAVGSNIRHLKVIKKFIAVLY
jgi:hypothetical protein